MWYAITHLILSDLYFKGFRVTFHNVVLCFLDDILTLIIIAAIFAATVYTTYLAIGKTLAIEF